MLASKEKPVETLVRQPAEVRLIIGGTALAFAEVFNSCLSSGPVNEAPP